MEQNSNNDVYFYSMIHIIVPLVHELQIYVSIFMYWYIFYVQFERPIICTGDALFIGSKLDLDVNTQSCRIAFHGRLLNPFSNADYRSTGKLCQRSLFVILYVQSVSCLKELDDGEVITSTWFVDDKQYDILY